MTTSVCTCKLVLCAVLQTYHTLRDMRVVFLDGTVLDTADPESRAAFLKVRCLSCHNTPLLPILRALAVPACLSLQHQTIVRTEVCFYRVLGI